ncbi:hypothetical protein AM587_10011217 [Phytophthora nicotianae]|uniref:Uncharacterized protein n=2 Tax=Phytophthora nicotianae TaxID=4792 RepID=A0A0W8CSP2_PHYNI|nr:hypothetical protein AM587_10011052 [Phytophthora nicotianae]KUF87296.1 hypothetical protein AM587_10011217 [Phytophthora nicotianae]
MAIKRQSSSEMSRSPPPPPPSMSLPSLPLPLFSLVLEFALFSYTPKLGPMRRECPGEYLYEVALVSKSWYQAVDELAARYRRDTMQLTLKFGSRAEVMEIRRQVQLRGRSVRDLRIRMGRSDGTRFATGVWWWMEDREIPWDIIFSQMPGLKRLDLRLMPLESRHLPILLKTAAKFCLQLEYLVLPRKQDMDERVNSAVIGKMTKVLRGAMERWHLKGKCGGLKQLTVPTREEEDKVRTSTRFIEDVIAFCPNVKFLDGYSHALDEMNDVTCEEKWMISVETWEKFNKTCTKLREFHWVVVPFADPFFRVFGDHVKPNLKKLTLTSNLSWDREEYFTRDASLGLPTEKPGYGLLASDVVAVFKGCPGLIELDIAIDQEKNEEALATLLDADIFGDKFWEAVVESCPLLQSVYVHDCSAFGGSRTVRPIQTFTDRSLLALADHSRLASIELSAVCCSGDGVFEFLQRIFKMKHYAGGNRTLDLSLAGPIDHDTALPHPFYFELITLLNRLAETSEEELGAISCSFKASLNIFNPHNSSVAKDWSTSYLRDELKPMLDKVASAHPFLDMHIILCRDNEESFRLIEHLELDWCPGSQQGDIFAEDEYLGDSDNDGGSDEEVIFDEEDGHLDPRGIFFRRHAMFMDDDYEVVLADEVDGDDGA